MNSSDQLAAIEGRHLRSTLSGESYPFDRLEEFADNGEALEVALPRVSQARPRAGRYIWQRFADFMPFSHMDADVSLGEGNTPLLTAPARLKQATGVENLLLKDETQNPTWSFKDRGSLTCIFMAREMGEDVTATISTGNMGNSIAAFAARAGLRAVVFIPHFAPEQKVQAIGIHGATVIRVAAPDYALMKSTILQMAGDFGLRIVSGNGPLRTEGYKLVAFELWEQMEGRVPDYIAVPTSACGHTRGMWKGWKELRDAGLIDKLPKMIVVQALNNSPLVTSIHQGVHHITPFANFHTIAEALTSGNPQGGEEIIAKAHEHGWLAESASEEEIVDGQRELAACGHFVEPATATSVHAIRKLRQAGRIGKDETVVMMLTGSGLKDLDNIDLHNLPVHDVPLNGVRDRLGNLLQNIG